MCFILILVYILIYLSVAGPLRIKFIHHEMNMSSPIANADSLLKLEKIQNFQSDRPGEIIFVEVPQLHKITKAHVAVGAGRTIYFSSEACKCNEKVEFQCLLSGKLLNFGFEQLAVCLHGFWIHGFFSLIHCDIL